MLTTKEKNGAGRENMREIWKPVVVRWHATHPLDFYDTSSDCHSYKGILRTFSKAVVVKSDVTRQCGEFKSPQVIGDEQINKPRIDSIDTPGRTEMIFDKVPS
ncbi:hypothetical protein CEXT_346651 [Caerostris extrusa]|uniref:Uncharacterized protein n=1 Tax=Caerostris extrusa TaxID=172846 RepID=A0AAV4NYB0_CAEEX|nr:hypothetical protein CEXT_346651 [Caerostris extrusa]